jgi:transglutaminase superfamily protein
VLTYFLPRDVHVCLLNDCAVFLDLERDAYIGLNAEQSQLLRRLLFGSEDCASFSDQSRTLAKSLMSTKLITSNPERGRQAVMMVAEPAETALINRSMLLPKPLSVAHIASVFASVVLTAAQLRVRPLRSVVRDVETLARRRPDRFTTQQMALTKELCSIYFQLQPFLFVAKDKCLLESVSLLRFLSRHDIYPTLIFGVTSAPFRAHCWLQMGTHVLNTPVETAREYVPIMAI